MHTPFSASMCPPVLFLYLRAVATLPASCYFSARCSMEKHLAANGARRERRDNGVEPRTCAPAVATVQSISNCHPIPRRSSPVPVFLRQITRHTCRVNFELTHSKQRIGAIAKCHTFRGSGLPRWDSYLFGCRAGRRLPRAPRRDYYGHVERALDEGEVR